ncbi:MAG TPA: hypothetical protein VNW06_09605, partial [Cytophagaceae bacterium]|nr:hypothetical protein [Cytophagaceae bacterium]
MKPALKKVLFFAAALLYVYSAQAIDLQSKIPKNALYVATINGQNVLAKMPMAALEKLSVMKYLCQSLTKDSGEVKMADLGVNIGSSSYFFVEMSDSIIYFTYLFPLSDAKKFEASFIKKSEITKDAPGNKSIVKKGMTIAWNNDYAMIIGGEAISNYFTKYPGVYRNYGFESEPENIGIDAVYDGTDYVDTVAVTVSPTEIDTMAVVVDTTKYQDNYSYNNNNTFPDSWSTKYDQRKKIAVIWKQRKAAEIFALVPAESISSNIKFTKGQDKTAEACIWMGSNQGTLYNLMSSFYRDAFKMSYKKAPALDSDSPLFSDENYLNASIHCNSTNVKVDFNTTLDHRLVSDYSKMTKAKLNKKFFKYIPGENLLGYYSGAYSTQGIMEAMPHLMAPYLKMVPYTNDISSELIDLYALFIDEQAIGKLVKGDGIFAVTNIVSKEVPYTSYEYDSLYNYTEVTKTKN